MRFISKILLSCLLLIAGDIKAQLTVGTGGLYIKSGATILLDRLQLQPNQDISIQNNTMSVSNIPAPGNPNASITRVYQWTDTIQTKGLIGMYVLSSELNGNNLSQLQLAYNPDTDPNGYVVSTNSFVFTASSFVFETVPTISWKQLTAVQTGSVLPLQLLSFTGKKMDGFSLLQWKVVNEENINGYTVQRSTNGKDFTDIGFLPADCNGCNTERSYRIEDHHPLTGNNYYKLKITDVNGRHSYADIVNLYYETATPTLTISPNPVENILTISGLDATKVYELQITSSEGKTVYTATLRRQPGSYTIDASGWASGTYMVIVTDKQGSAYRLKIIKK